MSYTSSALKGVFFENAARQLLRLKGYKILSQNKNWGGVEIDILARKKRTLVLVEVKYRQSRDKGHIALHPEQRQRLHRQGQQLAEDTPYFKDARLDVVLFFPHRPFVQHIRNVDFAP